MANFGSYNFLMNNNDDELVMMSGIFSISILNKYLLLFYLGNGLKYHPSVAVTGGHESTIFPRASRSGRYLTISLMSSKLFVNDFPVGLGCRPP